MSMKEVHQALYRFWSGFGVDAYIKDHVPSDATFPYLTFEVTNGDSFTEQVLTAFDWHQAENGRNVNAERAELMSNIAEKIPSHIKIDEKRNLWLVRNQAGFQSYYDDPDDEEVIGGRTSYIVHYFC